MAAADEGPVIAVNVMTRAPVGFAGVPSIVFGLFGNAFFSVFLGLGFSILSGGLTARLIWRAGRHSATRRSRL